MKLAHLERLSIDETYARLREVRLKGLGAPLVYAGSRLSLERAISTQILVPAQRYVLKTNLYNVSSMAALFAKEGIDIFALDGTLLFWLEDGGHIKGPISMTPPIVEEWHEVGGHMIWLINDGMHRVMIARLRGRLINIVLIRDVPSIWPYYAIPLHGRWAEVEELNTLPASYQKKNYRQPEDRKALFRDFNTVFPSIQQER